MFRGKWSGFTLSLGNQWRSKSIQNVSSSSNRVVRVIVILKELVLCKINNRHLESALTKSMKNIFSFVKILSMKLPSFHWTFGFRKILNKHSKQLTFSFENLSMRRQRLGWRTEEPHSPANTSWTKPFRNTRRSSLGLETIQRPPYATRLHCLLARSVGSFVLTPSSRVL